MFEYDQDAVTKLLSDNLEFRRLYGKHQKLKAQVTDARVGALDIDDLKLESLKKEKLFLKDRMAEIIRDYRAIH